MDGRSKGLKGEGIEGGRRDKKHWEGRKEGGREGLSGGGDEMRNTCNI